MKTNENKKSSDEIRENSSSGPKTSAGKRRSSRNATKHGIFSKDIVLATEDRRDYESLLNDLLEHYQPHGTLERFNIEKIAHGLWRYRRFNLAEKSEIEKSTQFVDWDESRKRVAEAEQICSLRTETQAEGGLIRHISNSEVLDRCLDLLDNLREGFRVRGFEEDHDTSILEQLYGGLDDNHVHTCLHDIYRSWAATAECAEEERLLEGYPTQAECKKKVLAAIDTEIGDLQRFRDEQTAIETERTQLEISRRTIPEGPVLERYVRYAAFLDRSIERSLSQLLQLQELRLRQPVAR